jgi:hypothetical protein
VQLDNMARMATSLSHWIQIDKGVSLFGEVAMEHGEMEGQMRRPFSLSLSLSLSLFSFLFFFFSFSFLLQDSSPRIPTSRLVQSFIRYARHYIVYCIYCIYLHQIEASAWFRVTSWRWDTTLIPCLGSCKTSEGLWHTWAYQSSFYSTSITKLQSSGD